MQNTRFICDYKALQVILVLLFTLSPAISNASELNVYSGRKGKLIKPLLDRFHDETGIKVNIVTAKSDALIKRIEAEGKSSPADIFITVDAGRIDSLVSNFSKHFKGTTFRSAPLIAGEGVCVGATPGGARHVLLQPDGIRPAAPAAADALVAGADDAQQRREHRQQPQPVQQA